MILSIRNKLIIGFSFIFTLLIFMVIFMSDKLHESNERIVYLVDVSGQRINLSNELMIEVLQATRHEKNIILEQDTTQLEFHRSLLFLSLELIDKKTSELELISDPSGKQIIAEFKAIWKSYREDLNKIISHTFKSEFQLASRISVEEGSTIRDAAINQLEKLIAKNEIGMEQAKAENDEDFSSTLGLISTLLIISIVLAAIISWLIVMSITGRISKIVLEAEKIASRESSDRPPNKINDELKPILTSLEKITDSFNEVAFNADRVASGDYSVDLIPRSEKDTLGKALTKMTRSLRESSEANERHNWVTKGQNQLNELLSGDKKLEELAGNTIQFLCTYLDASIGALYAINEGGSRFILSGKYALSSMDETPSNFSFEEGLIGEVASGQKQISLDNLHEGYLRITSSIINAAPKHILITPFVFEGKTIGVIEIGRFNAFSPAEKQFVTGLMENIAVSFSSAISRQKIYDLLHESKIQTEELQAQQEELRQMNEELEEQAQNLKQQQEELQMTNEELEQQANSLELKNTEVELAKSDIEHKTKQLEISSKYKSEFLANMSHELRTPLNSLLILSKDLAENKKKNLDEIQVECAEIIYKSGHDLLILINEVLDLSKIESGKMLLNIDSINLKSLTQNILLNFKHFAAEKGLKLNVRIDDNLPESIQSDVQRLNQILKNLLSNAFKFTETGSVTLGIEKQTATLIKISVTDTGIGIPESKLMAVFEAFQQADGGTSRKYGGTGLGLSISRELAKLLGGEITLSSEENKGSVFSLIIPIVLLDEQQIQGKTTEDETFRSEIVESEFRNYPSIADDRNSIVSADKLVLIVEDDPIFAKILLNLINEKGYKCLAASTGEDGLLLAQKFYPQAIILDMNLPGITGNTFLQRLKADESLRHIPIQIISANDRSMKPLMKGAISYLIKPVEKIELDEALSNIESFVNRKIRNLLIVEDNENSRKAIKLLVCNDDLNCLDASSGREALEIFKNHEIDCMILDLGLPDMTGFEFLKQLELIGGESIPPVIIYTGRELSKEENAELEKYSESIIIKGLKSEERLLDETSLFLYKTSSSFPKEAPVKVFDKELVFTGKKILLADDDMRNVFALKLVLTEREMEVLRAENGRAALQMLDDHPEIDLVLMDIMMPEMDGFEAMRAIRSQTRFRNLPIIALTAKAMKEDKQKCIDAGANDYVTKPIDVDKLLSLMRVWLSK
ncbi:MAG: response regulator [Bacteroidia bacterium]